MQWPRSLLSSRSSAYFALFAGGLLVGASTFFLYEKSCVSRYSFVNQSLACEEKNTVKKSSMAAFRKELVDFIETEKMSGKISEASIFFRDLNAGPIFGINELENFSPASLLKMPLALTYLQMEEANPGTLKKNIKYTKDFKTNQVQFFKPSKSIIKGESYTIEEVLVHLLVYSDNISYGVLAEYLNSVPYGKNFAFQTYQELGVINPTKPEQEVVTTHGYATIFRLLYNVSFLNPQLSEKMLGWLAESEFDKGLVAGVPSSINVAHKFGERFFEDRAKPKQLHDCGIVYFPNNPYVLCVMTRGNDWENMADFIKTVSSKVYEEMNSRTL